VLTKTLAAIPDDGETGDKKWQEEGKKAFGPRSCPSFR
jgi:hypothetical protein